MTSTLIARVAASVALGLAVVLVAVIVLSSGTSYQVRLLFADAGGLVSGDGVLIGPAQVGTVRSIGLTRSGQAAITVSLDADAAPLHTGTVARIAENGLAGIASHYVTLEPGPLGNATIPSGATLTQAHTYSEVALDQLFNTFDPLTRAGIRNVIRGEADAIRGRGIQANRTLRYLAPALLSTSEVTAELARSEPAFDALLVQGARTMRALGSRSAELTQLVAGAEQTTGALAQQASALRAALALLPSALTRSTTTFAGLRSTLDALDPLVAAAKPATVHLTAFSAALRRLATTSLPALTELAGLIHNPSGGGDLTKLLQGTPALARIASVTFPQIIRELDQSQPQLDYLREYTPDVIAALTNLAQASATYDANGHYTRTQPFFGAFGLNSNNQLTPRPPSARYDGLQTVHGRCPGSAVQPTPDGSAPERVPGCNPSATPPGP